MPFDESGRRTGKLVEFTDKDGRAFRLSPKALHHIRHDHCIADPASFIQEVFSNTITIVESKVKPETRLYYSAHGKHLYKVVVVNTEDRRIKTALVVSGIKGGGVIWVAPRLMN